LTPDQPMRKTSTLIAAAALLISDAQNQTPRNYDSSGAPRSSGSSPRSGGGLAYNATTGAGKPTDMTTDDHSLIAHGTAS
jgi:hypothetical protein